MTLLKYGIIIIINGQAYEKTPNIWRNSSKEHGQDCRGGQRSKLPQGFKVQGAS